jgi:hypothetical protein
VSEGNLEPAGNWCFETRHWSLNLHPNTWGHPGRVGTSLCGRDVWDQEYVDRFPNPRTIVDLPLCKLCERSAARLDPKVWHRK